MAKKSDAAKKKTKKGPVGVKETRVGKLDRSRYRRAAGPTAAVRRKLSDKLKQRLNENNDNYDSRIAEQNKKFKENVTDKKWRYKLAQTGTTRGYYWEKVFDKNGNPVMDPETGKQKTKKIFPGRSKHNKPAKEKKRIDDEKYDDEVQKFVAWRNDPDVYKNFNFWAAQNGARPLILNSGGAAKVQYAPACGKGLKPNTIIAERKGNPGNVIIKFGCKETKATKSKGIKEPVLIKKRSELSKFTKKKKKVTKKKPKNDENNNAKKTTKQKKIKKLQKEMKTPKRKRSRSRSSSDEIPLENKKAKKQQNANNNQGTNNQGAKKSKKKEAEKKGIVQGANYTRNGAPSHQVALDIAREYWRLLMEEEITATKRKGETQEQHLTKLLIKTITYAVKDIRKIFGLQTLSKDGKKQLAGIYNNLRNQSITNNNPSEDDLVAVLAGTLEQALKMEKDDKGEPKDAIRLSVFK